MRATYLVTADLELGHVPGGVLVRRPLDVPELRLVGRVVVLNVERELELEELVALVPVNVSIEAEERTRVPLERSGDRVQGYLCAESQSLAAGIPRFRGDIPAH